MYFLHGVVSFEVAHSIPLFFSLCLCRCFGSCLLTVSSSPLSETQLLLPALPSLTINPPHQLSERPHPWQPSWLIPEPSTGQAPGVIIMPATCSGLTLASPSPQSRRSLKGILMPPRTPALCSFVCCHPEAAPEPTHWTPTFWSIQPLQGLQVIVRCPALPLLIQGLLHSSSGVWIGWIQSLT